jgi:hypothetical protein
MPTEATVKLPSHTTCSTSSVILYGMLAMAAASRLHGRPAALTSVMRSDRVLHSRQHGMVPQPAGASLYA